MAAVLSETITESSHFPKMGRDERQSSPSTYRRTSRSHSRPSTSPRTRPTESIPSQPAANTLISPASSTQHIDSRAAAQPQANPQRSQSTSHTDPSPLRPISPSHSPLQRAAYSSDDISDYGGATVVVKDLQHIESFATEEFMSRRSRSGRRRTGSDPPLKYEISAMPITDIIEMVAGLLTKITTTNDRQHESLHRPMPTGESAANIPGLTSSVLAFHGKNVPSITILSYLSRIHKYCPTTYEVFLSLLVYFDRMTERVNAGPIQEIQRASGAHSGSRPSTAGAHSEEDLEMFRSPSSSALQPGGEDAIRAQYATPPDEDQNSYNLSHFFVVDSFNIHRLVIAGVTCASKFFSDVFYTNSRYAKVGGLPLQELNHLELQFLLLNDFRLSVPVEELEAYGTMLVEFYAREVIGQKVAAGAAESPAEVMDVDAAVGGAHGSGRAAHDEDEDEDDGVDEDAADSD